MDPRCPPKTDDELHDYIQTFLGYNIARTSVCAEHDAPFTPLADLFFQRTTRALIIASRGAGKTLLTSILEWLLATFNSNYHIFHAGAIDEQAKRGYEYVRSYMHNPNFKGVVDPRDSIMSSTRWQNGSFLEIRSATMNQTSGAHPHLKVADELERWKPEVYQQFIGMGTTDSIQTVFISTREKAYGLVQQLVEEAHSKDIRVYNFCVWETKEPCPVCIEYRCLVYPACQARYQYSSGHRTVKNIADKFLLSDFETWKTQQLCDLPGSSGLCFPTFNAIPSTIPEQSNVNPAVQYDPHYPVELWCDDNTAQPRAILFVQIKYFNGIERLTIFGEYYEKGRLQSQSIAEVLERLKEYYESYYEQHPNEPIPNTPKLLYLPELAVIPQEALELKIAFHDQWIATLSPKNYRRVEGVSIANRFIQDVHGRRLLVFHPDCINAVKSIQKLHRAEIALDVYGEEPVKSSDDHFADSLMYGCFRYKYGLNE